MQTFIARQPIFNESQKVHAYELMYRSGPDLWSAGADETTASTRVIADVCMLIDGDQLTEGKKAFVKVNRDTLLNGYANMLPANSAVIELQESVEPEAAVIETCAALRGQGFELALDVCVYQDRLRPLVEAVDLVKVDFLANPDARQQALVEDFSAQGKRFVAHKVETPDSFRRAREIGYHFFQGYFLSRPALVARKEVPAFKLNNLRLLQEVNRPEMSEQQIEAIIKQDLSLSFKLLRHINSAQFGLSREVNSIKQALALLGEKAVRRWASLVAFASMATDKPEELIIQAATRAKFCELVAPTTRLGHRADELFLMGMFSMLDALLDRELAEVLKDVPLARDLKDALTGAGCGEAHDFYSYVLAYEQADWSRVEKCAARLAADESLLPQLYIDSVFWAAKNLRAGALN